MFLYADDFLVVVAKVSGELVHPGWARDGAILMRRVRDALGRRVYPVHRLDRGASGAVVLALDPATARALAEAFAGHEVEKRYLALVRGVPPLEGVVDHPIPRRPRGPRVPAVTAYRRLEVFGRYALVECHPTSGRLHQVRRHMKHLSCPLIGDVNYGKGEHNRLFRERYGLRRLALHASHLAFRHPHTGARIAVDAPLPDDLAVPLARLAAEHAAVTPSG